MRKVFICFVLIIFFKQIGYTQSKTDASEIKNKMQWFADAKLGIFVHWGIYAVNGINESWSFHNKEISWLDYMKQLQGFTASKYDPDAWAKLIKASGARYAVITTKHHDGVALWPTKQKHYNVVANTPARRDLLGPFYQALEKYGIKKGAYYSLLDWSHPDYPGFLKDSSRYSIKNDAARWNRFLKFNEAQLHEIGQNYHPDLWWFDGDWEHSAEEWQAPAIRKTLLSDNPSAIINGRLMGYGDYETPEQNFPVTRPDFSWWELCMTTNNQWGYQPRDTMWKTPYEVITIFADVIANGGNLLLDIGPREDGTIQMEQINILTELGKWNQKHSEAIFGTLGGMPPGHFYGPSTISKDSSTVYLFLTGNAEKSIMVKGLVNKIKKTRLVGTTAELPSKIVGKISWSKVPGLVYIDVPEKSQDQYMTIIALELDGPLKLYSGKGGL